MPFPSPVQKSEKKSEVAQSCPTLCDPMDCSLPGSSVHGIFQTRVLQWVAISFSRGSSQPRDQTRLSCIAGRGFYHLSRQGSLKETVEERNCCYICKLGSPTGLVIPEPTILRLSLFINERAHMRKKKIFLECCHFLELFLFN